MVIAFQVVLLIVIFGSSGNVVNKEIKTERAHTSLALCLAAMFSFIVSVVWL